LQFDRQDKLFHLQLVIDGHDAIDRYVHDITGFQVLQGLKEIRFHINHVTTDLRDDIAKFCRREEYDVKTTANESMGARRQ
jgi:hypothetical protein